MCSEFDKNRSLYRKYYDEGRATDLFVRCGEWDTRRVVEPIPHQDRPVVDVAVHPGFDRKNLTDNVALLFTETPFILGHSLDKICLPSSNYDSNSRYNWDECVSTGWGKDQFGDEGEFQVVLKQVGATLEFVTYSCYTKYDVCEWVIYIDFNHCR